jgi:hypothetical protein
MPQRGERERRKWGGGEAPLGAEDLLAVRRGNEALEVQLAVDQLSLWFIRATGVATRVSKC